MSRKEQVHWISRNELRKPIGKQGGKSVYLKLKELLEKNKDKAYTRKGLVKELNPAVKEGTKEMNHLYWRVAFALECLEEDSFIGVQTGGNPEFYYWKD